jgi:hypothetical protein
MARIMTAALLLFALGIAPCLATAQTPVVCDGIIGGPSLAADAPPAHYVSATQTATLSFNPSLDPALETVFGDAASRTAAFVQAVNDWNIALSNVGASLVLTPTIDAAAWASGQNYVYCQEPVGLLSDVYTDVRTGHFNDGTNEFSTAENPGLANLDPLLNPLGPGWVLPASYVGNDTTTGMVAIDAVLAAPKLKFDTVNPAVVVEADVVWYTHTHYEPTGSDPACPRTSWDFSYPSGPDAQRYDFYSVMLHSIGHLLGVGHQGLDDGGNNVMQAGLAKGARRAIGVKELMCLCERYGPGAPFCPGPTSAHRSTWGRLKSAYR